MKLKSLIITLVALIAFCSNVFSQDSIPLDRIIATIGNSIIKYSEVQNQIVQMRKEGISITPKSECEVLEQIMFQKLLLDQVAIDSIEVADKQVDDEINRRIDLFAEQIGSREKLESFYGKTILEIRTEWRALVKEQLLAQQMQSSIISDVEVSPEDVRKYFKSIHEDSLPMINPQYIIAQIVVKPKINIAQKKELREKLEGYRKRAIDGESFSKLAALYSDDTQSAKKGGDLGFVTRAELVPEFAAMGFKLKEGEISRIVETDYGFHIIQCVERKKDRARLRHILLIPKETNEQLMISKARADSIYNLLKMDSISFKNAAFFFSDDKNTKNNGGLYANPFTGASKFEAKEMDPNIYNAIRDLKNGAISSPFLTTDETGRKVYKIVQLISNIPAHKANLKQDYSVIKQLAENNKNQTTIFNWVSEKQKKTYIRIDKQYKNCDYFYPNWFYTF